MQVKPLRVWQTPRLECQLEHQQIQSGLAQEDVSEQDCRSFLPLPPRNDESQNLWGIQTGDALLTFGEQDKRGIPWRHIAIVQAAPGA